MTLHLFSVIIDSMLCIGGLFVSEDLIFNIRLTYFALEKVKHLYFEKQNLTASQGDLLLYLGFASRVKDEISQKDIEQHFRLSNPTVTGLLNRLEEKGFVKRQKSTIDGRTNNILLTEKSTDVLNQFKSHKEAMDQKICRGFSNDDVKQLVKYLKNIQTNLKSEDIK